MFIREMGHPLSDLRGCGPKARADLEKLGLRSVADFALFPPRDYDDRTMAIPLSEFARHAKVNSVVEVLGHDWFGFGRMKTLKVLVRDESAEAVLVCFNRPFLEKQLLVGQRYRVNGAFTLKYGEIQSTSFDFEAIEDEGKAKRGTGDGMKSGEDDDAGDENGNENDLDIDANPGEGQNAFMPGGSVRPVYPLAGSLTQGLMRKLGKQVAITWAARAEEELPRGLAEKHGLLPTPLALRALHLPASEEDATKARKSLAFTEFFYLELAIARRAGEREKIRLERSPVKGKLAEGLRARLTFALTADQENAIAEILADMGRPRPMARLLQGDVGSGKTLVAFFAALDAIERGQQAALMAPTELLARQHADTAARLLEPIGVRVAFLSGNLRQEGRRHLLDALKAGDIDLCVGTHALFSRDVSFRDLGVAIVDEQHRFGVMQRLALGAKSEKSDLLMMTATPIPRSLALTSFGDLSVSVIRQMPAGRKPVTTWLAAQGKEEKVYDFVRKELAAGHQAYFVYPLIEASDKVELKNAVEMYEELSRDKLAGYRVGIIHSKIQEDEKRATMLAFSRGEIQVLVATSVVEVGVDVANATCMVIEHAERFGLASLHQLRGRVGRGDAQSYAFLVYDPELGADAKERLKAMHESTDGFKLAEEDLRIRGPGEITGARQSGDLELRFGDFIRDFALLQDARQEAFAIVAEDPALGRAEHKVIAELLRRAPPFSDSGGGG